jgi:hypothetical protein
MEGALLAFAGKMDVDPRSQQASKPAGREPTPSPLMQNTGSWPRSTTTTSAMPLCL